MPSRLSQCPPVPRSNPVVLHDYTPTQELVGPEEFLAASRLLAVGCLACRRYFYKALGSDRTRMGPVLLLIAQLCQVAKQAQRLASAGRLEVRRPQPRPILSKLRRYLGRSRRKSCPRDPSPRCALRSQKLGRRSLAISKMGI
ncbi:MAG: IS66 family transposase [Terriglobia bacterium]